MPVNFKTPKRRNAIKKNNDTLAKENKALRRKLEQMEKTMAKKEIIIDLHAKEIGTRLQCDALGVPRATYYRFRKDVCKPK